MPGIAAIAPVIGALTSAAPAIGAFGTILSAVSSKKAPGGSSAPAVPAAAEAPAAPEVSGADDVDPGQAQVDTEAARVRASKRRKASEGKRLFSLEQEDDSVTLTKTLLGG